MVFRKNQELYTGGNIPRLGLGVWKVEDEDEISSSIKWALETGYRLIDISLVYKNEAGVGEGICQSRIPREEVYITAKLRNSEQGYEAILKAFDESLRNLGLDYIDLYLIHWPVNDRFEESWKAMEEIYESGRAKAIGISTFHEQYGTNIVKDRKIVSMVDRAELHSKLRRES